MICQILKISSQALLLLSFTTSVFAVQDSFGGGGGMRQQPQQQYPTQNQGTSGNSGNSRSNDMPQRGMPSGQSGGGGNLSAVSRMEDQDFGVKPTRMLHKSPMHAPTPTRIPGGLVITTEALAGLLKKHGRKIIIFDVLGSNRGLPWARNALPAGQGGSFNDQVQGEFARYLEKQTKGNKSAPVVFYCQSPKCWLSYNAALRAINLGYKQVLWYRGGINAWEMAGFRTFKKEQ